MKNNKLGARIVSGALVLSILGSNVAWAQSNVMKEETVYVNLEQTGSPKEVISSVWIHSDEELIGVKDKSNLKNIINIKGDEEPEEIAGNLIWDVRDKDLYYQGNSESNLPVQTRISYTFNGKQVDPEEIAGEDGQLTLKIEFTNLDEHQVQMKNGKNRTLYSPYVVATVIDLPMENFRNVHTSQGKKLSDGNDDILSFVTIPGLKDSLNLKEDLLDLSDTIEITADVTDFQMKPIVMVMTTDIPEAEELYNADDLDSLTEGLDKLADAGDQLTKATRQLHNGQVELDSGIRQFAVGVDSLAAGSKELSQGSDSLTDGLQKAYSGSQKLGEGGATLDSSAGQLGDGYDQLGRGIDEFSSKTEELADGVSQLSQGIKSVPDGLNKLSRAMDSVVDNTGKLVKGQRDLSDGLGQSVRGARQLRDGQEELSAGLDQMEGELRKASGQLNNALSLSGVEGLVYDQVYNELSRTEEGSHLADLVASSVARMVSRELSDQIYSANRDLNSKMDEALNGVYQLQDGSRKIANGLGDLERGLEKAEDGAYELSKGTEKLNDGQEEIAYNLDKLAGGTEKLNEAAGKLSNGSSQLAAGSREISSNTNKLNDGFYKFAEGTRTFSNSTLELASGLKELSDGSVALNSGIKDLSKGADQLYGASGKLVEGSGKLASGSGQLESGMSQFKGDGLDKITGKVEAGEIDIADLIEVKDKMMDLSKNNKSFSGKDESMDGKVKFVMKTSSVKSDGDHKLTEDDFDDQDQEEEKGLLGKMADFFKGIFKKDVDVEDKEEDKSNNEE